jgi:hypothetical protein
MPGFYIGDGIYEEDNTFHDALFGSNLPTLPQISQRLILSQLVILLSVKKAEGCLRQLAGEWGLEPNNTTTKKA